MLAHPVPSQHLFGSSGLTVPLSRQVASATTCSTVTNASTSSRRMPSSSQLRTSATGPTTRMNDLSAKATCTTSNLDVVKITAAPTDRAKLTEQWGPPPVEIKRDHELLQRGHLLGEGGFARVYLVTEPDGITHKAVKVICKEQLKSTKNRSKLFGEIKIHQSMQHRNIVSFEHCFEDDSNVYMQLELCLNGSLLDLLRRRKRYTEPETRFYLVQLIGACHYMHSNSVIHRDLKLGNLMLDAEMNLRVGDFGLAALVKFPGERKKTICGTPNYIAPEILFDTTNGHSFEVDIWSLGVIMYTLLIGKPPFQTKEVKNIYRRIKDLNYEFPPGCELSVEAVDLISSILTQQPDKRPSLADILQHDFFITGPFPPAITASSLNAPPDYRHMSIRAAHRNFKAVKRQAGIVEEDEAVTLSTTTTASRSSLLPSVAEEEFSKTAVSARPIATTSDARGIEQEVQQVLAPESPISDLLKSARKPLMVSPDAEPRELLQRRLAAEARSNTNPSNGAPLSARLGVNAQTKDNLGSGADKENSPATGRQTLGQTKLLRSALSNANSVPVALSPSRNVNVKVQAVSTALLPKPATQPSETTRHPARELYDFTWRCLEAALTIETTADLDDLPRPSMAEAPKVFITSWVDYTHKYGTAFSLTDGSAGLFFNDSTTMVLSPDKSHFDYISNRKGNVYSRRHYTLANRPEELQRKAYLLEYFEDYMAKTLTRDVSWTFLDAARIKNMCFLVKYYRMKSAIVFKLSNDVLQFNFYDHTKVLLTQNGSVVSFIDGDFKLRTYSIGALFDEASRLGHYQVRCANEVKSKRLEKVRFLIDKLTYCRDVLKTLSLRKKGAVDGTAAEAEV